ncbi:MAG: AAA family ATPase [Coprobacillaceae bacterium]
MKHRIMSIAREYGSGGRLIAQEVARELQLVYYDNEIIDMAAEEMGMDIRKIREMAEEKSSGLLYSLGSSMQELPLNDQIFIRQSKIIRHLAEHDSCIIVNGCADYVLEDYDDVIKVFIHAPMESRIARVKDEYYEERDDYKKYIKKRDKRRSNYYNYYTDKKWGNLKNFDITINSDIGIEQVVKILVEAYKNGGK